MLRRAWRATFGPETWRRLLYATISALLAVPGGVYALFVLGEAFSVIGVLLLAAGLRGARAWGRLHRALIARLLDTRIPEPPPRSWPTGVFDWVRSSLTDTTAWRALLFLGLKLPLGMVQLGIVLGVWATGAFSLLYPLWWWMAPGGALTGFDTWPRALALAAGGAALLAAAPWVTRGLVGVDAALARALLGPTEKSLLREGRAAAVDQSAARLRRIERDLHDGAQAQLVALAMQLGLAREELRDGEVTAALALVDTAHARAKQAIVDLRDLARGIHPPVLDGGLPAAFQSLRTRSVIPVDVIVELPERPSPAVEAIVYFTAAELLTNAGKHSGAQRVTLGVAPAGPGWLRLTVTDDGVGGARPHPDGTGGLTGLGERLKAVGGRLDLASPLAGPTVVTVELPLRA
ncbi:sensor histidine kinase [Phytohabitans sp. LJ34]|uniref:sensor histidine kinase n=1 Tax=Phytohabitans sp. LJ34 TaxID=3452217 RepID=UPI003F8CA6C1